jgi:hypothetical protein
MITLSKASGPFAARFWHRLGFFDHGTARQPGARHPFAPARRFSAHFGRFGRCAHLCQNRWQTSADWPGGDDLASAFPRVNLRLAQPTCQHQLIQRRRHDQTPAFKLLRGAHAGFGPEEILLEKASLCAQARSDGKRSRPPRRMAGERDPGSKTNSRPDRAWSLWLVPAAHERPSPHSLGLVENAEDARRSPGSAGPLGRCPATPRRAPPRFPAYFPERGLHRGVGLLVFPSAQVGLLERAGDCASDASVLLLPGADRQPETVQSDTSDQPTGAPHRANGTASVPSVPWRAGSPSASLQCAVGSGWLPNCCAALARA